MARKKTIRKVTKASKKKAARPALWVRVRRKMADLFPRLRGLVNLQDLSVAISKVEGKKKEIDIAQIKEILSVLIMLDAAARQYGQDVTALSILRNASDRVLLKAKKS